MEKVIPRYTFYKNKYGSELLVDVVELGDIKKFLKTTPVHTLTYYDITFITEGAGSFSIDNQFHKVCPGDVIFSKPGEIRSWDNNHIINGYALIFEEEFLSSFFKDDLFVQHLCYFDPGKTAAKIHLPELLYERILRQLCSIKEEIDLFSRHGDHVLRAQLYEILMLLDRIYKEVGMKAGITKEGRSLHINNFIYWVNQSFKEHRAVGYYADKLCITPNYLNEVVMGSMQVSAKQYIYNKVMGEGKRMLAYTNLTVSEIASQLNYDTVSYFIRSFRSHVGQTPLAYRKAHKP
ncbi:helix-turn-helix domain-containing protein [Parabacteroides sp.]